MRFFLFLFMIGFGFALSGTARADVPQIVQCGVPRPENMTTTPAYDYCNVYERRFTYSEDYKKLDENIKERAVNYNKARLAALQTYEEKHTSGWKYEPIPLPIKGREREREEPVSMTYHVLAQ